MAFLFENKVSGYGHMVYNTVIGTVPNATKQVIVYRRPVSFFSVSSSVTVYLAEFNLE